MRDQSGNVDTPDYFDEDGSKVAQEKTEGVCVCVCVCVYVYIYMYMYMYICIYIYIHINIYYVLPRLGKIVSIPPALLEP